MQDKRWQLQLWDAFTLKGVPRATIAYAVFCAACTLLVGSQFFASLKWQLFMSQARTGVHVGQLWSAPLDDVFIHFDFARAAARGYPFQWSEGNGYSSGGTSLIYPLVLALGYRIGYSSLDLMLWAGIVACISVWAMLVYSRRLLHGLPEWSHFAFPPIVLGVGALDWSLFSGMEVALFLAIWAWCVVLWAKLVERPSNRSATMLGVGCAALVACRPESAVLVAVFCFAALALVWRTCSWEQRISVLLLGALPGAAIVVAHSVANKLLTGDWSAAGALVKLEMNDPHLNAQQVLDAWKFHVEYQVMRVTGYHFSDVEVPVFGLPVSTGWLMWLLALLPLVPKSTRKAAVLLWASMIAWVCMIALNGQVRWQNERYTMPAVAWLLMSGATGTCWALAAWGSAIAGWHGRQLSAKRTAAWSLLGASALAAVVTFAAIQRERFVGQLWFFGRASRNIFEQHIRAAALIRQSSATRVLVGDAGAIPYVADIPALDIIGLGGYHDLPFARATRLGIAAGIELLQRMEAGERPDLLAIYPSWWGDFPSWFGQLLTDVPVRGNVICGGRSKVLYRPDWTSLDNSKSPFELQRNERVVDELDFADLVNERERNFQQQPGPQYVTMKQLPHRKVRTRDAWDAGRVLPQGESASFALGGFLPHEPVTLIIRTAPNENQTLRVTVNGEVQDLELTPSDDWQEQRLDFPPHHIHERLTITVEASVGAPVLYHLWGVQQK